MITESMRIHPLWLCIALIAMMQMPGCSYAAEVTLDPKGTNPNETATRFEINYFSFADDPLYQKRRAYTGVTLKRQVRPLEGVKLGIRGVRIIGRSLGIRFELIQHSLERKSNYVAQVMEALADSRSTAAILDLPKAAMLEVTAALRDKPVILFNARLRDDDLRGSACAARLFHTIPSHAMLLDALNQYLKSRDWSRVLMLTGPLDEDAALRHAYRKSANKFAIQIVGDKHFVHGQDPRNRNATNVSLLTGGSRHDIIFVADSLGEFARYVPYQTHHARLIVGSEGLIPDAWHWTWERHGAPQLNQRFAKQFDAQMTAEQWAGWVAVKALVAAARMASSVDHAKLLSALRSQQLILDLYKGAPGSFRAWNNQLRQPMLLRTHNAVVARAPLEGFLHHHNTLDTLGSDEAESACRW